jgi:23S rRNA (uridine2479-2'-O)-methyltransferase
MTKSHPEIMKISTENNYFQHFEVLKNNRNKRLRYGEFFVEGVRNINEAVRNGWQIKSYLYSRDKPLSDWAANILNHFTGGMRFELTEPLITKLSDKEDTSELIAIVEMPPDDITNIDDDENMILVVFDRPANKGNLGTVIRSCDALGVNGLIITGHAVDLYDPEVIRASTGSFFKLPMVRIPSFNEVSTYIGQLKHRYPQLRVVGTSEKGEAAIDEYDFTGPVVVLLGNEAEGLSQSYAEISDALVRIPMSSTTSASSLNVACAASIFLYEVNRQRNTHTH